MESMVTRPGGAWSEALRVGGINSRADRSVAAENTAKGTAEGKGDKDDEEAEDEADDRAGGSQLARSSFSDVTPNTSVRSGARTVMLCLCAGGAVWCGVVGEVLPSK